MNSHDGFLNAINADPDDDVPRLIYADWLDDQGEPERAEFIRIQCRAATLPWEDERDALEDRADELLRRHEDEWLASLGSAARSCEHHRGFLARVYPRPEDYSQCFGALFGVGPACTVCFDVSRGGAPEEAFPSLDAERLIGLDLSGWPPETAARWLDRAGSLARLRSLDISLRFSSSISEAQTESALQLLQRESLPCLQSLALRGWGITDARLSSLIHAEILSGLKLLDLRANHSISDDGLRWLASSPALTALETLSLGDVTERGMHLLSESPHLARLSNLELEFLHGDPGPAVGALASSSLIGRLEALSVCLVGGGHRSLAPLYNARGASRLKRLTLQATYVPFPEMVVLAASPLLQHLESLDLRGTGMPRTLPMLLESPALGPLRELRLTGTLLWVEDMRALADWPGLKQLRHLDLTRCNLPGSALAELLRGLEGGRLRVLRFENDRNPDPGRLLFEARGLERVRELDLRGGPLESEDMAPLLYSDALPALSVLRLGNRRFNRPLIDLLVGSPLVSRLRLLDLRPANNIPQNSAARLLALLGCHVDVSGSYT